MATPSTSASFASVFVLAVCSSAQSPALEWRLEAVPPSRSFCSIARHEGIDATVLFGGQSFTAMNDTWLWRGSWQRVVTAAAPRQRYGAGMVYDSLRQRLVLFGGRDDNTMLADTWAFDGVAWTQLAPQQAPPARHRHAMGYDAVRDRVVVKSGLVSFLGLETADLWEFDGSTWQQKAQAGSVPGSGLVGSFVYDAARQDLLLIGFGVTAWDGTNWSPRSTVGLSGGLFGTPQYDAVGQRVLLFPPEQPGGGAQTVMAWQGESWSPAATSPGFADRAVAVAYDAGRAQAVGLRSVAGSSGDNRSHTLVWSGFGSPGTGWQLAVPGLPPGRRDAMFGYDRARRRAVLFGGGQGQFDTGDVYEADDRLWSPVNLTSFVAEDGRFAYDTQAQRLVGFGTSGGVTRLWSFTGSFFEFVPGSNTLPVRFGPGVAYDSARQRLLVFGGQLSGAGVTNQLWAWNGTAWTNLTTTGPSARRDPAMCYDPVRDRLVVFGGTNVDGTTFSGETWEHDGSTWQLRTPASSPAPRAGSVLVYASHLQRCILVGGFHSQDLRDTWTWDGSNWTELTTAGRPDTGIGLAGVYDPDRREVLVFGGGGFVGAATVANRGELWRLVDPTLATWERRGVGCDAGAGLLRLDALDPPSIDSTCRFELQNTLATFVALPLAWAGFDDLAWGGAPLPLSLDALGFPACSVYTGVQVPIPMLPLGTRATGSIALPDTPAALGLRLHFQGAVWNLANGAVATSDFLTATVGAN